MLPRDLIDLMMNMGLFPVVLGTLSSRGDVHAPGKAISCYGSAHLVLERIEEVKFPLSVPEIAIGACGEQPLPWSYHNGYNPLCPYGGFEKSCGARLGCT